jgi:hypothetical protein
MKNPDWRWDFNAIPSRGREAIGFGLMNRFAGRRSMGTKTLSESPMLVLDGAIRQVNVALQNATGKAGQSVLCGVSVNGGESAGVTCIQEL